ncbi:MAG: response regulator [Chloroflexi bacterium]|nr:response regulator [Chloroflexota bacterium]
MTDIRPTVMVVDDDWMIREIMQAHLENAGYRVLTAHSGERALELAAEHTPDLVILDIRMQGISGHEVCARLKAAANTRHSAVLITTAMEDDESRRRAVDAGADDFLAKPFDAVVMLTRVKSLLRIKRLQDELDHRDRRLRDTLARYLDAETARLILADLGASPANDQAAT